MGSVQPVSVLSLARAALAACVAVEGDSREAVTLRAWAGIVTPEVLNQALAADPAWSRLVACCDLPELLVAALLADVETDPLVGRLLAWIQAPVGGARPNVGLAVRLARVLSGDIQVEDIAMGRAAAMGLYAVADGAGPLPERALLLPPPILLALRGRAARPPGAVLGDAHLPPLRLPPSVLAEAARQAEALRAGRALVVRSGLENEARHVAAAVARALGKLPCFVDDAPFAGLVPWLILSDAVPIFARRTAPGERVQLPDLRGWSGPILVASGHDGTVEVHGGAAAQWTVPVPAADERRVLWAATLGDEALAQALADTHRHGAGRIAEIGRLAAHHAAVNGRSAVALADVHAAAWQGDTGGLDALAQPLRARIPDAALVVPEGLRRELQQLVVRCRRRESLVDGLGLATVTRYRPGVRALFVGPSGTGKTLAAGWLATQLGLPIYRVDLASVMSKYIGETEKNLAELLARAEASEVVLFFDEADTLFGKRTEVRQSTDRFANAQTNYLLQRIESYDGVVVLASNSAARFDPAFSRRLDVIVEFPPPGPEERRALWLAHVGPRLAPRELNLLAAHCDLAGGHVRSAVLAASVIAAEASRPLVFADLVEGVARELRKLGRPLPAALAEVSR